MFFHNEIIKDAIVCGVVTALHHKIVIGMRSGSKYPLGRPRCRWEDNIKLDLQEVGCGGMDWIGLAQDRGRWQALVNAEMNLCVP
jgi:hypothetical protein